LLDLRGQVPSREVEALPQERAEASAREEAGHARDRGDQADGRDREHEGRVQHRQRDAHRERVDARRDREHEHRLPREGIDALGALGVAAPRFPQHLATQEREKREGDPVRPRLDEGPDPRAEEPPGDGHQRLRAERAPA
jgi:hypothetical protein